MPTKLKVGNLTLQWHITNECDQRCRHCYLFDSTQPTLTPSQYLDWNSCKAVIDDLALTAIRWGARSTLALTGGDPLLHPDFFHILSYGQKMGISTILVMGNPFHIDQAIAKDLAKFGIGYQISLDGLHSTHDRIRRKGSFAESLRAIDELRNAGVHTALAFTLSRINQHELLDTMHLAADLKVNGFGFDLLTPIGRGKALYDQILSPEELKDTFGQVVMLERDLSQKGVQTHWGRKPNLWKLWLYEYDKLDRKTLAQAAVRGEFVGGCLLGDSALAVQADGNVVLCPRLPISIGQVPRNTISQILTDSPLLKLFRQAKNYQKCSACPLVSVCRGCPASAFSISGNPFSPDPYCWMKTTQSELPANKYSHFSDLITEKTIIKSISPEGTGQSTSEIKQCRFTAQEKGTLRKRGFWLRKLIERDEQPHLRHAMFDESYGIASLRKHTEAQKENRIFPHLFYFKGRRFSFDPLELCVVENIDAAANSEAISNSRDAKLEPARSAGTLIPTFHISTRQRDWMTKIPPTPYYILIEGKDGVSDLRRILADIYQVARREQLRGIGLRMYAHSLTDKIVMALKRFNIELVLEFEWPTDFNARGNKTDFSLPAVASKLLQATISHYGGRLTASVNGAPLDIAAMINALRKSGFRSIDIPQFLASSGREYYPSQWKAILSLVREGLYNRDFIDFVPITNILRRLYSHQILPQQKTACYQCWASTICDVSVDINSNRNCAALPFSDDILSLFIELKEKDPEGLRIFSQTPRGLLKTDQELSQAMGNDILYFTG